MAKQLRSLRVPAEFDDFISDLSVDFSRQTGFPVNKSATMRRMATKLNGKLVTRGADFDFIVFGRKRKRI